MLLWVGLGNPEPSQARHRHNIGFMALELIAKQHGFSTWRQKYRGLVSEGVIAGERIVALKPMTYMNASGQAVQLAAAYSNAGPNDIWVFHDELDLLPGKVRVKKGGGAAGHNGLRDIQRALGTPDYWRVRLGIGHPGHKEKVHGHVLGNFAKQDELWLGEMLSALTDAVHLLAEARPEDFMTRVALLTQEKT